MSLVSSGGSLIRVLVVRRPLVSLLVLWVALVGAAAATGSQLDESTPFDRRMTAWFVDRRTPRWNRVTELFSELGSTIVVILIVVLLIAFLAVVHRPVGIVVLALAMIGEVTMFLTITFLVDRPRPAVLRLDSAPPTSSFPSGHTMATFVLWNSIAVVAVRADWSTALRALCRVLGVAMPIAVAASRLYRGMHHATDVLASLLIGLAWITAVAAVITPDAFRRRFGDVSEIDAASPASTSPQLRGRTRSAFARR